MRITVLRQAFVIKGVMDMKNVRITFASVLILVVVGAFAVNTTMAAQPDRTAHPPIHIHDAQTSSPTGLTPVQILHAYGFDNSSLNCSYTGTWGSSNLCGYGQTIAIVDAFDDPNIASDLATFSTQFGLPSCTTANGCFVKAMPQGKTRIDKNWALEISLDVEWAHAIAPGAKILLVEARSNTVSNLLGAVDYAAKQPGVHQVSMSWGAGEFSGESGYDYHFQVNGVSFLASSGDQGSILWPAASPNVISVGGTTLNVDSQGNVISETAWNSGGYSSGGGISCCESIPGYQSTFSIPTTNGKRGVPDVSYVADNISVLDSLSGGWFVVGGTSVGSPQWSAVVGIVNSNRSTPLSTNSLSTNYLYTAATTSTNYNNLNNYRDITSGCNTVGFCAMRGYDFVTGLGSPLANNSIPYLQKI